MDKYIWYIGTDNLYIDNVEHEIKFAKYNIKYHESKKFKKDHIFCEINNCFILLDGVIFNKLDLMGNNKSWEETVYNLKDKSNFPDMMRGSFSGAIIYKDGRIMAFTDHCGEKPVFVYSKDNKLMICTDLLLYRRWMECAGIKLTPYNPYIRYMLSYGFMIEDCTCYTEVKRLMPSYSFFYDKGNVSTEKYHNFDNTNLSTLSDEEAIKKIDELFRNAIRLEFGKDSEYGYKHIVDISGGLDCRIVNYVAKEMGYTDILNITYSQTGSNEFKTSLKMAKHLNNELLFYPLDSADFIFDADKIIQMNNGLCVYATSTGASKILSLINMDEFGIEHGGLLGDIRDGAFPGHTYCEHKPADVSSGMQFSNTYHLSEDIRSISSLYPNQEMFDVYTRGMLGGLSTIMIRNYYCEYYAPFMDPDFYDFYLSMPLEQRVKGEIFKVWIKKYYPQAYEVEEDRTMCKIDAPKYIKLLAKVKNKIEREYHQFGMRHHLFYKQNSMNPFEYWYMTNPMIRDFVFEYYEKNKNLLNFDREAVSIASDIMKKENLRDMTMVLSVLSALKIYFKDLDMEYER